MDLKNDKNHIPWIVFGAKEWLDINLKKNMRIFEWGSGGSTLYFCNRVKHVISVEHDKNWYKKVKYILLKEKNNNCDYNFIEPKNIPFLKYFPYNSNLYNSDTFQKYRGYSFKKYVNRINDYPDNFFDIVFVDGRARSSCIKNSIRKIKKGGYLILDNSERKSYENSRKKLDKFERIDFRGHGPYIDSIWETSIWKII